MANGAMTDHTSRAQEQTQAVKVAVHVRPLIPDEVLQGCKNCVHIPPEEPQVQIGNSCFTFDHVFGGTALSSSRIFEDCVAPLVDDLFNGYNATVLAYGQTGSGKTYTMGTSYAVGSSTDGVIPRVMDLIFRKIGTSMERVEYRLRVSFIEILNEEVYDLLDLSSSIIARPETYVGAYTRPPMPAKSSIQIRETIAGGITLVGATEIEVNSLREMAALLERGSSSRATGSTNMNLQSSRSHAIFTIILQQRRESLNCGALSVENFCDDILSAKLHLVDLAGSERVKRTRTDGIRFKEGVNINRGLLALGNVISALGDEKRRKDGAHVPYRDSKLTRLLQDSLGGNSRTLMIACISPADSNAEETLNTLKYANRARNIQNKPVINRDPVSAEIHHMRQQLELLQAELLCIRAGGGTFDEIHREERIIVKSRPVGQNIDSVEKALKQRLAWVEGNNADLRQELQQARDSLQFCAQRVMDVMIERDDLRHKLDLLQSGKTWIGVNQCNGCQTCCFSDVQELESHIDQIRIADSEYSALSPQLVFNRHTDCSNELSLDLQVSSQGFGHMNPHSNDEENEAIAKELEHTRLRDSMNKELQDLTERLKQKEDEMMMFMKLDNAVLKQQFERKVKELEDEKMLLQEEKDRLLQEIKNLASISEGQAQRIQEAHAEKLKDLEAQLAGLKDRQTQLLKQNLHSDDTIKALQDEILRMKSQKVQLQQRIKHESESLRSWKASREKELLQLRKETRKNEHEMLKLQALNQRQKMVLQRKTEEAAMATRRLKDVLEARKLSVPDNSSARPKSATQKVKQVNLKSLQQSLERELEVSVHIHEVRSNYEKQAELRASLAREMESLKQEEKLQQKFDSGSLSPSVNVRKERSALLQSLLDTSSRALVAMGSELSDVEERQNSFSGPGFLQHLESVEDAKALLQHLFSMAVDFRCQLSDKSVENKELKENIGNVNELLKQSEAKRREDRQVQQLKKHAIAKAIATSSQVGSGVSISQGTEDLSITPSQPKSFKAQELYSHNLDLFGLLNAEAQHSFSKDEKPTETWVGTKLYKAPQSRKRRLKRSHDQWRLHFKWSWQKPWRLSDWIRHGDESLHARSPNVVIDII